MILRKIPFVNKKHYSPGGPPVVAAECGQRICWKIQNGGANNRDSVLYYIRKDVNIERLWFYTTYTRVCQRNFIYYNKHISKVCFVRIQSRGYSNRKPIQRIRFLWFGLRETQSYNIDESVWYNYVYNIYAKLNLFIKSLFKLLINLLH